MNKLIHAVILGMFALAGHTALADPGNGPSVTVVNPASSPAITSSIDERGRSPYQLTHRFVTSECLANLIGCEFSPPAVPKGKRLVVQHVALGSITSSGVSFVNVEVLDTSAALNVLTSFNVPVYAAPAGGTANADQSVQFYVESGNSFTAIINVVSGTFSSVIPGSLNITGYLVDCTINSCAPITP